MRDPEGCGGPLLSALATAESPQCSLVKLVQEHMHLKGEPIKRKHLRLVF